MLWKTHLAFGFLFGLLVMPLVNYGNKYIYFALVLLGALLVDIDSPNSKISNKAGILAKATQTFTKHRGIFHSIFFAILIPGLVWYFIGHQYGTALFVGYLSHLIIDGFTKAGVNFLHPIATLRLHGFIETGSTAETLSFILIIAAIIFKLGIFNMIF